MQSRLHRRLASCATAAPARPGAGYDDPRAAVLRLQRAAGNRATVAALARDKKRETACAAPGFARAVTIQPVFFKASEGDRSPTGVTWKKRWAAATAIWSKLGVTFTAATPIVKVDAKLKTAGANFQELGEIANSVDGDGIEVFMVDRDLDFPGARGGATVRAGSENAKVVLSDRGKNQNLLAHELGHVLGIGHPKSRSNPGDPDTIMEPSKSNDVANPSDNTLWNYSQIQWPAPGDPTCLKPDPHVRRGPTEWAGPVPGLR